MNRSREETALAVLILLLAALVFLPSLRFPFVWDDIKVVRDNPFLRSPSFLPLYFQPHYWKYRVPIAENDYRPVQMIGLGAISWIAGASPLPFRLVAIALHLLVAGLVYRIARSLTVRPLAALIALALFALHPVHVEAVASARNLSEFLAATFLLLSFRFFVGSAPGARSARGRTAAIVFFILAVFSKESAVIYPLILLLFPADRRSPVSWPTRLKKILPFLLIAAGVIVLKIALGPGQTGRRTVSAFNALFACSKLTWVYLKLLLWPLRLHVIYPFVKPVVWTRPDWFLSLLFLLSLLLLIARLRISRPRAGWAALAFLASLLPALSVVGQIGRVVAEQRLYFPSVFACLFAGMALSALLARGRGPLPAAGAGAIVVLGLAYALSARHYLLFWGSDYTLWKRVTEVCPAAPIGHNNLAVVYLRLGEPDRGTEELRAALALNPEHSEARSNLGVQYRRTGRWEEAIREFELSLESSPSYDLAAINLSEILLNLGRLERSEKTIRDALAYNPYIPELHNCLAVVLERRGNREQAEKEYRRAAELNPEYGAPLRNLSAMLQEWGKRKEAEAAARDAIARDPYNPAGPQALARIYIARGDFRRAKAALEEAIRLDPANISLRSQLMALKSVGTSGKP